MRLRLFFFSLLLLALILPLPTHGANPDCASYALVPRLAVGGVARIAYSQAGGSRLQEYPGLNARGIGSLSEGTPVTVVRGPTCADNIQWWQIRTLSGSVGWSAEGTEGHYALEPWQILLDVAQQTSDGVRLFRVNDRAAMRALTYFTMARVPGSVRDVFPVHESGLLQKALAETLKQCPAIWEHEDPMAARLKTAETLPADRGMVTTYTAPDAARLLVIRHLWRTVPHCDGTRSPIYGMDRVSLSGLDGEQLLFDLPANASLPGWPSHIDGTLNHVIDIRWSPDNVHALVWAQFGDRSRLMLLDTRTGTLTMLDDGIYPTWLPDGKHLSWLRRDGSVTNLLIARADGSERQTITLPATLRYTDAPFPPTWNDAATWLLACTERNNCAYVVPIDLTTRRTLAPLSPPITAKGVRWILADAALLWLPERGGTFAVQAIRGGEAHLLTLPLTEGEQIVDARPFPDGKAALVTVHSEQTGTRYAILNFDTMSITPISSLVTQ